MLLLIDHGNSALKWAIAEGKKIIATGQEETFGKIVNDYDVKKIFVSNVAGTHGQQKINGWAEKNNLPEPTFIETEKKFLELVNGYKTPKQLGVDRWLVMIAAWQRSQKAFIVIDAGTAITLDFVDHQGQHQGGYILPGFKLMRQSLVQGTDGCSMPGIDWQIQQLEPGTDTQQATGAGILSAIGHFIEYQAAQNPEANIFITGGSAQLLLPFCGENRQYCPHLLFEGMIDYSLAEEPQIVAF